MPLEGETTIWRPPGYDSLTYEVCVGMGFCGAWIDDVPRHIDDYIPASGSVSADQFTDWLLLAEGMDPMEGERFREGIRAAFVRHMGGDSVDASLLKWKTVMVNNDWPALDWPTWRETAIVLQLRTQIVGKVRLALTPWLNHSWHVPLYLSVHGLTTSAIPVGSRILQIDFDLIGDALILATSDGAERRLALAAGSIADFHRDVMAALHEFGIDCHYDPKPSEMPDALPFAEDHAHRPYDGDAARNFWRALIEVSRVFGEFRTGFLGKASPVHFFWGSFDLAATRFSGRVAPKHPGGMPGLPDAVTCEAYSHEEASIGFWPGSDAYPHAAFYAYAYPSPDGYADAKVAPADAAWNADLGEFLLPYEAVRAAADPDAALLAFCRSTYDAAADLGAWDRKSLECPTGRPGIPRQV